MKIKFILFLFIILIATFLRFNNIANNPPGLYIDEVSLGYNAHTILTKGVDEYGVSYPIVFRSFGDYKMPVYIYLTAASEYFFGETEFAVRFPSALCGVLTVVVFYFLIQELLIAAKLQKVKLYEWLPLFSTLLLAISRWHLQFSRGGFEVNVAFFFYVFALYAVCRYRNTKMFVYLVTGAFFFVMTLYTYFIFRILTPLTMLIVVIALFKSKTISIKQIVSLFVFVLFLSLPTLLFSFSQEGMARFSQTTAFNALQGKSFLEKLYSYPMIYLKNYVSYFSIPFLFVSGDGIGRHQMPWFGILPIWQLPFLLGGIFIQFRKKNLLTFAILGMLIISPLAASLAVPSPHTLRDITMMLPLTLLVSIGVLGAYQAKMKFARLAVVCMFLIAVFEFISYQHFYYSHYPRVNELDWGAGYKPMVQEIAKRKNAYAAILIDSRISFSKTYFQFYDESITPIIIDDTWKRPKEFEGKKLLLVRPSGIASGGKLIQNIYIPDSVNNDIFVQLLEL